MRKMREDNTLNQIEVIMKLKEILKRNPCSECDYYIKENNTCQSKKCGTGGDGRVDFIDKLFCEPYKDLNNDD